MPDTGLTDRSKQIEFAFIWKHDIKPHFGYSGLIFIAWQFPTSVDSSLSSLTALSRHYAFLEANGSQPTSVSMNVLALGKLGLNLNSTLPVSGFWCFHCQTILFHIRLHGWSNLGSDWCANQCLHTWFYEAELQIFPGSHNAK